MEVEMVRAVKHVDSTSALLVEGLPVINVFARVGVDDIKEDSQAELVRSVNERFEVFGRPVA